MRLDDAAPRKGRAFLPMNNTTRPALLAAKEAALTDNVIEYAGRPVKSIEPASPTLSSARVSGMSGSTIFATRRQ